MALCKNMQIHNCCLPNALMTLQEYLEDYAAPETKAKGIKRIKEELADIPETNPIKQQLLEKLSKVEAGERDLFF